MTKNYFQRAIILFLISLIFSTSLQAQTKVAGISLPNTLTIDNKTLLLNGAGVREKYWMNMYAGGLYLTEKNNEPQKIITSTQPMAIRLHIVSGLITSEKMEEAINEGFEKSTNGKTQALKTRIDEFTAAFREEIKQGDIFDIVYSANTISILKNNKLKAKIKGHDFKEALFGIWLSANPADENLKKGMLGLKK